MARAYSEDLRKRVVAKRAAGKTVAEIMNELEVKQNFVYTTLKLHKTTGSVAPKAASGGRPPKLGDAELARIEAFVLETPDATLLEIKEALNLPTSISRICDAINYKLNLPRKKRHSLTKDKTEKM